MQKNYYNTKIVKVIDGDTVDVDIELGFGIWLHNERIRIAGIDAPESRTSDKVEKIFGLAAKSRLKELLKGNVTLVTTEGNDGEDEKGKFGRILGDFIVNDKMVSEILTEEGYCAASYFGGNKELVELQHLENRKRLILEGKVILPE